MLRTFKSSEFILYVLSGAVVAGSAYLGHPLALSSIVGLFSMVTAYTVGRFMYKHTKVQAILEAVKADPNYVSNLNYVIDTIQPLIVAFVSSKSKIAGLIVNKAIDKVQSELLEALQNVEKGKESK